MGNAEQSLPSSTTGLLIAAVPLVGVALAFLGGRAEQLGATAWAGLALGIAGVAALVGLDVGGSDLGAVAELGITVLGYAIGPAILARYLGALPGVGVMAIALSLTRCRLPADRADRRRRALRAPVRQRDLVGRCCWPRSARRPPS